MTKRLDLNLTRIATGYAPAGFIADRVFPIRPWGGEAQAHSLELDLFVADHLNADPGFIRAFEEGRVMRVMDALFLDWELRLAKLLLETQGIRRLPPVCCWANLEHADPLADLTAARAQLAGEATHVLFSGTAWRQFRRTDQVIARTGATRAATYPSVNQVENLLGLTVLVGNAWRNSASEGQAINLSQVWGDHVVVYRAAEGMSLGWCDRVSGPQVFGEGHRAVVTLVQNEYLDDEGMGCVIRDTVSNQN